MKKVNMELSELRATFKGEIDKLYGDNTFTTKEAESAVISSGLKKTQWCGLRSLLNNYCKTDEKGIFTFKDRCGISEKKTPSKEAVKKEIKNTVKKDWEILNENVVSVESLENPVMDFKVKTTTNTVINLIPKKDPQYVAWGHFKDIKTILESKIFYPLFVTGLSGN